MTKIEDVALINGMGHVVRVNGPLDVQLRYLKKRDIDRLATPEEILKINFKEMGNLGSRKYLRSRTSLAGVSKKGQPTILTKGSPLMDIWVANLAVEEHRSGREFRFNEGLYDLARQEAEGQKKLDFEDRTAVALPLLDRVELRASTPLSRFLFGGNVIPYFNNFVLGRADKGIIDLETSPYKGMGVTLNALSLKLCEDHMYLDLARENLSDVEPGLGIAALD